MKKYLSLILLIISFEIISGGIGHLNMGAVRGWYEGLQRPGFAPPNWVFPVVWTTLYAMIATAGWVIWRMPQGRERKVLLTPQDYTDILAAALKGSLAEKKQAA